MSTEEITLIVYGDPSAQKRHRHFARGKFHGTYDTSSNEKKDFLLMVQDKAPDKPFDCPLEVDMRFYFSHPKSHFGTGKNSNVLKASTPKLHIKRPDLDNCTKYILDSLNKVFWRDDSIICHIEASKHYSIKPRVEIVIKILSTK